METNRRKFIGTGLKLARFEWHNRCRYLFQDAVRKKRTKGQEVSRRKI